MRVNQIDDDLETAVSLLMQAIVAKKECIERFEKFILKLDHIERHQFEIEVMSTTVMKELHEKTTATRKLIANLEQIMQIFMDRIKYHSSPMAKLAQRRLKNCREQIKPLYEEINLVLNLCKDVLFKFINIMQKVRPDLKVVLDLSDDEEETISFSTEG